MAIKKDCQASHDIDDIKSVYMGKKKESRKVVCFNCGCWDYWYRFVWVQKNGEIPDGYEVHHIDDNPHNDNINNLQLLTEEEHKALHGKKRVWSEETKKKISDSLKSNPDLSDIQKEQWKKRKASDWKYPEEGKKKLSEYGKTLVGELNPFFGKKHSAESIDKNRQAHLGKPSPLKGKKMSDEARRKMSEAKKGKPSPRKGKPMSEEAKQKLSESQKKRLAERRMNREQ